MICVRLSLMMNVLECKCIIEKQKCKNLQKCHEVDEVEIKPAVDR